MRVKMMQSLGAHQSSGYPSDTLCHVYHQVPCYLLTKVYNSLKCCDEKTGKCASNLKNGYGVDVYAHPYDAVCWCPSIVWLSIRQSFPGALSVYLAENVQQFEVL